MANQCRLLHRWSKWSEPFEGIARPPYYGEWRTGAAAVGIPTMLQKRTCERCGKKEWQRV